MMKTRSDFPVLRILMHGKPLVYLDSAATAQKPQCVIDAITNFYSQSYGTVHRALYRLSTQATEQYEKTRIKAQKFLNANKAEEIIFTRGTTESINLIANSFGKAFVNPGDEIIITETEHHSNIVPWQVLCEDRKAHLKVVPVDDQGNLVLNTYRSYLNEKTKLVAIAHVANTTGTIHPLNQIISYAHEFGAKVLVDGAQAAPHMPVDVRDLDVDFYAFSGHKTYGPTGVGILYGKEGLLEMMPPYQCGGDMIEIVTFAKTKYNELPLKFEAGTPLIGEVIGLGAAFDYLGAIGLENIHAWEQTLLTKAMQGLQEIPGLRIIGTSSVKGPIVSFVIDGIHPVDMGTLLDLRGIAIRTGHQCAQPTMKRFSVSSTMRISFGLYNTVEEIDIFLTALKDSIPSIRSCNSQGLRSPR